MNNLFVSYELSLLAKEKGFDEPCLGHYQDNIEMFTHNSIKGKLNLGFLGQCKSEPYDWNNVPNWGVKTQKFYSAPLYQQLVDWFREKHKLHLDVTFREVKGNIVSGINSVYFDIEIYMLSGGDAHKIYKFSEYSDNYYETLTKAIEQAFLLI